MAKGGQSAKGAGPLAEAWRLYESGDVVGARSEARRVLAGQPDERLRLEASDLLERTQPPRFAWPYLVTALAVLLALVLWAALR